MRPPPGAWRLLVPALLGWAAGAGAIALPGTAVLLALVASLCGALAGAAVGLRMRRARRVVSSPAGLSARRGAVSGAVLVATALLALLGARIAVAEHVRADPVLADAAARGVAVEVEARLAGFPHTKRSPLGDRSWVRAAARVPRGEVPVLLWLDGAPEPGWAPGIAVSVRGRPERLAPTSSEAFGLSGASVRAVASRSPGETLGNRVGAAAAAVRERLRAQAETVTGAELVPGFAVGDTALVGEGLDRAMRESSLTHLTAVSGANCALVTGGALWLLGRLGAGRRVRLLAAGVGLLLFVVLVGPDASVQRAAVMAGVLLVSGFGGKRAAALSSLGVAVVVLLLTDPWQGLQPGFALSVAATAGILLLAPSIASRLRRRARLPPLLALPVAVALAAQLACGPLLLLLQPGIPAVGVLANVLAAPAAPLGTGMGLAAGLFGPLSSPLAHAAVVLASVPARWVGATAQVSASVPLARWHWPEGWPGALLLAACEAGLLLAWALRRGHLGLPGGARVRRRAPWAPEPAVPLGIRIATAGLACGAAGLFVAITLVAPLTDRLGAPNGWAVVACDVGQGDALLLRDPARPAEVMLVDTGDDPIALLGCLDRFGVRRIGLLVLTHDDRDHVGALPAVIDRVDAALLSPTVRGEQTGSREVVRRLRGAGVRFRFGAAGEGWSPSEGLAWRLLAPAGGSPPADRNAASLVLAVRAGPVRALLLADTGLEEQRALLRNAAERPETAGLLRAEVLKVAHHGSRDQDPRLPSAVGAEWALVSVGAENRYGHPAAETLAAAARAGARVLRTDSAGAIALIPQPGGSIRAWVERGGG